MDTILEIAFVILLHLIMIVATLGILILGSKLILQALGED